MTTLVIGGTGHIGGFLLQQLLEDGHDLIVVSSGRTPLDPAVQHRVETVQMSYNQMLSDGSFQALLVQKKVDAVVDILQGDSMGIYAASKAAGVRQIVFCGSVWMFGRPKVVPTPEITQTPCPFGGYESRYAQMCEVIKVSAGSGISVSSIMPPNICGPGKIPLDGMGDRSIDVHLAHQRGEEVVMPYPGTNLIGPCDADDVARGFACALRNPEAAAGEIFNVGAAYALTSEQFIRVYADIYGIPIPIRYVEPGEYVRDVLPDLGANFHFLEHMCPDISKISSRLGCTPKYTPEATMERAVNWMRGQGLL
jgi:nucleoside-diphosphate-sugar epimerase